MNTEQLQKVVDAENKRLNEINLEKALVRTRKIVALRKLREDTTKDVNKQIEDLQKEIAELPFDSVTAEDIVNGFGPAAPATPAA